ncbi:MAG: PAS domain S-box protein [Betaproteobacteria bacterium]|nr:PAS domain S-box protein [Betaproteobacteria bacterium]
MALAFLLSLAGTAPSHARGNSPIFILHSYSQEYPWTKRQHEGFLRKLGAAVPDTIAASVEYLDTKRVPYSAAYADLIAGHLAQKYAGFEPKLIYVTDDNALLFALTHLIRIFPKAPVFFSGINDYDVKQRIDPHHVTGVFENKEIAPNLELMRHLAPGVRDILVVGDESETYQAIRREIVAELARQPDIQARFVSSGRIERLVAALQGRREQFVFLTTLGAMRDAAGNTLTLPETIAAIVQAGRFIVVSMEDVYLYPGVLGGYVTSGYKQGAAAAELSARYLAGSAMADINPVEASPNEYIIDGSELEVLGLTLPPGIAGHATILNRLPTFYERNFRLIVQSLYVFALLFVASLVAFIYTLMRKNWQIARTSEDLAAQTERLRTVIEGLPVVLWAIDRQGVFTFSRGAGLKALGLMPDEVVGDSPFEIYRDIPTIVANVRRALAGESHVSTDWVGDLAFETYYAPLRDATGAVIGATGVSADVSERKRSEEALREAQSLLQLIVDSSPSMIFVKDAQGRAVFVNRYLAEYYGASPGHLLSKLTEEVHGETEESAKFAFDDMEVIRTRKAIVKEELNTAPSGERHWFHTIKIPLVRANGNVEVLGIATDITERKQAEASNARLAAIVETSNDAIIGRDLERRIVSWNAAAARLFGYTAAEAVGQNVSIIIPPDREEEAAHNRELLQQGRALSDLETVRLAKGGRRIDVSLSQSPIKTASGAVVGIALIFRDISERKQAEAARATLEAQLRESQKMEALGTLAGGVAHDFNNALAAIIGNTELARQDVGPGHAALESLDEIRKASRRAKELVQQILAFSRRQVLERKVVPLAPVVQEAATLLRATIPAAVSLNFACAPNAPPVLADAMQIVQVLINLCSNAWHSIEGQERAGVIEVRLEAESRNGLHYAALTVRDNGRGMDEATRSRIFEPFFTTKPVDKGTGLGLSVVHGILQAHEASIEVSSTPGEGTIFVIRFPAARLPAAPVAEQDEAVGDNDTGGTPVSQAKGKHVLYVDDDESIVHLTTRLLQRQGYRVSGYTDPREALAAARADPGQFDLAVTDYNMPGMSGLDVVQALKEIRSDLPVVLASGYVTEELRAKARAAGVRELIYKPNTADDLCEAVARVADAQSRKESSC